MKIIQTRFRDINPLGIFILLDQERYDACSKFILNLNKIKDFHKGPFKLYVAKIEKESIFKAFENYNVICRLITDKNDVPNYAVDSIPVKNDTDFLEALSDFIYELYDADLKSLKELIKKDSLFDEEKEIYEQILSLFTHPRNRLPERGVEENPLFDNIFEKAFNPYRPVRPSSHSVALHAVKEKADNPDQIKDRIREDRELERHVESVYESLMFITKAGIRIDKLFGILNLDVVYDDLTIELKKNTSSTGRRQYKIRFLFGRESHLSNLGAGDEIFLYVICLLFRKKDLPFRHRDLVWDEQDYDDLIDTNPKLKWLASLHKLIFDGSDGTRKNFKDRILSLGRDRGGGSRSYSQSMSQCNKRINNLLQQYSLTLSDHAKIASDRCLGTYSIPAPAEKIIIPEAFERLADNIPEEMK